jgi:hypothetical protein
MCRGFTQCECDEIAICNKRRDLTYIEDWKVHGTYMLMSVHE